MTRIADAGRRWDRAAVSESRLTGTHVIQIGRRVMSKHGRQIPQKIAGFLIARDSLASSGQLENKLVDMECMARLGCPDPKRIEAAVAGGYSSHGILPNHLDFCLLGKVTRDATGIWDLSSIYTEGYRCNLRMAKGDDEWKSVGTYCYGDGQAASRAQQDGSRKDIACHPVGKRGVDAKKFCEFSVRGECKVAAEFRCELYYRNPKTRRFEPLSSILNARFVFRTTAEASTMDWRGELEAVANFLAEEKPDGTATANLTGINGTLTFGIGQSKYVTKDGIKITKVPRVRMTLNVMQANARLSGAEPKLLGAPEAVSGVETRDGEAQTVDLATVTVTDPDDDYPEDEPSVRVKGAGPGHAPPQSMEARAAAATPEKVIPVADATPEELVEALDCHIRSGLGTGGDYAHAARSICKPIEYGGKSFKIPDPAAYLRVPPELQEVAHAALRATCAEIEAAGSEPFFVLRSVEVPE